MKIRLQEQDFCDFLKEKYPDELFRLGHSVIAINVVQLNPIMSCAYFSKEFIAIAKYNRQMGFFSDNLLIKQKEIAAIDFNKSGSTIKVTITLTELSPAGKPLSLALNLSLMTAVKWHQENLKKIVPK